MPDGVLSNQKKINQGKITKLDALIIGAGVYIYLREKVRDQMIVTDTPNR